MPDTQEREAFEVWFAGFRHGWKSEQDVAWAAWQARAALAAAAPAPKPRPGAERRARMMATAEGRAALADGRRALGLPPEEPPLGAPIAKEHDALLKEWADLAERMHATFGPAEPAPAYVPMTDEAWVKFAAADEFLLYCGEEEFVEIARAVEAEVLRRAGINARIQPETPAQQE